MTIKGNLIRVECHPDKSLKLHQVDTETIQGHGKEAYSEPKR